MAQTSEASSPLILEEGSYGVGLWKAIAKETSQLKQYCELVLGDGKRIRLWEDNWCGGQPLCEAFPGLYRFAESKGAMVVDMWVDTCDSGAWDPKFEKLFND